MAAVVISYDDFNHAGHWSYFFFSNSGRSHLAYLSTITCRRKRTIDQ